MQHLATGEKARGIMACSTQPLDSFGSLRLLSFRVEGRLVGVERGREAHAHLLVRVAGAVAEGTDVGAGQRVRPLSQSSAFFPTPKNPRGSWHAALSHEKETLGGSWHAALSHEKNPRGIMACGTQPRGKNLGGSWHIALSHQSIPRFPFPGIHFSRPSPPSQQK